MIDSIKKETRINWIDNTCAYDKLIGRKTVDIYVCINKIKIKKKEEK